MENEVKSRRIGPRWAFLGVWTGGTCRVPTGPAGWSIARPRPPLRPSSRTHHSRPLQGLPGPLRWFLTSPRDVGGLLLDPGITHLVTHPVYPPQYPPRTRTPSRVQCSVHVHSARYSSFRTRVGEPRGTRTHRCFRVSDWLYTVI